MKSIRSHGFTLVELAIVITIIGLLIGGVLKGQELLQNARMTSGAAKFKNITAATITFKDIYKALPGDIANPASFIKDCTTAPCNVSGDADGIIGGSGSIYQAENARYWMHLAKAGLISGVNPNSTFTAPTYFDASYPAFDMGGMITLWHANIPVGTLYVAGLQGHQYFPLFGSLAAGVAPAIPESLIAKFDLKVDDGKPFNGEVGIYDHADCPFTAGAPYNPNNSRNCYMVANTGF